MHVCMFVIMYTCKPMYVHIRTYVGRYLCMYVCVYSCV